MNLLQEALKKLKPHSIGKSAMGSVACALETIQGNIYHGVNIDTSCGLGSCAEYVAVTNMITNGEYHIKNMITVKESKDGEQYIVSPCSKCREFIYRSNPKNIETQIQVGKDKNIQLKELMPYLNRKEQIQ